MRKRIPNNIPPLIRAVMEWSLDFEDYDIINSVQLTKKAFAHESIESLEAIIAANKQSLLMASNALRQLSIKMMTLEDMLIVRKGLGNKGNATPKNVERDYKADSKPTTKRKRRTK